MYTNTFKNELTTDQKRKLLLNMCGIYFTVAMAQTEQGSLLCFFIMFDFILNIPVNNFFNYVGVGLPGLNQYLTMINVLLKDTTR